MARQELLHRGLVLLAADSEPVSAEVWTTGDVAVAFERTTNRVLGTLHAVVRGLDSENRLQLVGTEGSWTAAEPERPEGSWVGVSVLWPDEPKWETATVSWSNYRVTVSKQGQTARSLPGARTQVHGAQQWIQAGDLRIVVDSGRGTCVPCGGRRA